MPTQVARETIYAVAFARRHTSHDPAGPSFGGVRHSSLV
jgi:hypothetical protein